MSDFDDLKTREGDSLFGYMCFSSGKYKNGVPIPVDGETVEYKGDMNKLFIRGFHSCNNILDALYYGATDEVFLTESSGFIYHFEKIEGTINPRFVASKQKIIARKNIVNLLDSYLRDKAIEVLSLWEEPEDYENTLLFLKDLQKKI